MVGKDDLNLADGVAAARPKGGALKLVLIILVAVLLGAGAVGGALYFVLGSDPATTDPAAADTKRPLIYKALEPELLGNIDGPGRVRFVQVGVVMAMRDPKVGEAVDQHTPVIRNDLIMLLSGKTYEQLNSAEGKEATRQEMLETIRDVLDRNTGNPGVESIYFTSFVMQ
ncbi:MAG: flagellar basal body protein FliL [Thioalkalivibrio sp.]|nr:MAG: flagellar basal body protein FliL [Thioalkalivibrio sp.]